MIGFMCLFCLFIGTQDVLKPKMGMIFTVYYGLRFTMYINASFFFCNLTKIPHKYVPFVMSVGP